MPLSKARNRERMRALRATCVQPGGIESYDDNKKPVQPIHTIAGLEVEDNRILGCTKKAVQLGTPALDAVRCLAVLDADGYPMPDYD